MHYVTTLSKVPWKKGLGLYEKNEKIEKKRCIPKEGIPHARKACKINRNSPSSKEMEKSLVHENKFIHHPPKISTHMHILIKDYDLFLHWIRSLT